MEINCLIIEDDLIYRETILGFAKKIPTLNVVAACSSALEANTYLQAGNIQLMFSDIELGELSGLDFIKSLKNPPYTIFITSFPDYAVEGFQVEAVDYLVKPVTFDRFLKAVNKVHDRLKDVKSEEKLVMPQDDHFFVRVDSQYVKLKYDEVVYIEAYGDFVKIHTVNAVFVVLVNLKNIEEQLPSSIFIRTHRSYLVNASRIESIDNWEIRAMGSVIPLGKNYKDQVYASVVDKKLVKRSSEDSK